jgi:hypothetical protein
MKFLISRGFENITLSYFEQGIFLSTKHHKKVLEKFMRIKYASSIDRNDSLDLNFNKKKYYEDRIIKFL